MAESLERQLITKLNEGTTKNDINIINIILLLFFIDCRIINMQFRCRINALSNNLLFGGFMDMIHKNVIKGLDL